MKHTVIRTAALGVALLSALSTGSALAQNQPSQPLQARVVSSTPVTEAGGHTSYNVTYEYAGRRYSTRTDYPPGATLPIEVNAYGVATLPVAPQNSLEQTQDPRGNWQNAAPEPRGNWQNVAPEPGVVVSSGPAPSPNVYYSAPPAPVYVQPAYTYAAPYPYYAQPYYAQPYYAPIAPIGLSLNLGYSRGWGGGHRGWR